MSNDVAGFGSGCTTLYFIISLVLYIVYIDTKCEHLLNTCLIEIVYTVVLVVGIIATAITMHWAAVVVLGVGLLTAVANVIYRSIALFALEFDCKDRPLWITLTVVIALAYFSIFVLLCVATGLLIQYCCQKRDTPAHTEI